MSYVLQNVVPIVVTIRMLIFLQSILRTVGVEQLARFCRVSCRTADILGVTSLDPNDRGLGEHPDCSSPRNRGHAKPGRATSGLVRTGPRHATILSQQPHRPHRSALILEVCIVAVANFSARAGCRTAIARTWSAGTLELVGPEGRLAHWRFTAGRAPRVRDMVRRHQSLRNGSAEPEIPATTVCPTAASTSPRVRSAVRPVLPPNRSRHFLPCID